MLQSFRDNLKGTVATVLVGLMIIPFALFGVDSLFLESGRAQEAAIVDGDAISEAELQQAIYLQKQQLIARFGNQVPADFIADERLRGPILEDLVRRRLVTHAADKGGLAMSAAAVDKIILAAPQFQVDGRFDSQRYTQVIRSMGFTPSTYRVILEQEMLLSQLSQGIENSGFSTAAELERVASLREQTRDFYLMTLDVAKIQESVVADEEKIAAHYEANQSQYMAPQKIRIEYLDVSPDDFVESVQVSEDDVRQQYEQDVANFEASIERHAAHILFELSDDESAQANAEAAVARLNAGESFADLAAELSADTVSAEQGGDLGYTAGDIFPEAFEEALAALEPGAYSAPVETDAGIHIIKLLDVQDTQAPSFEEEQMRVRADLEAAMAEERFVEMLEDLGDLTYNADSLQEAAEVLDLKLETSELFSRSGGVGVTANNAILEAAFSAEVLEEGNTSDVIELSDSRVFVLRVVENQAAHVKPLVDVSADIKSMLEIQMARDQLQAQAEGIQSELKAGADFESVAKAQGLEWLVAIESKRSETKFDRAVVDHVFSLPKPADEAQISGVFLTNGDYAVVSLNKVEAGQLARIPAAEQVQMRTGLASSGGQQDYATLEAFWREMATVEVN